MPALTFTRRTSGASATNSAAAFRMRSGSPPAQRVSTRKLRPCTQPSLPNSRKALVHYRVVSHGDLQHADAPRMLALLRSCCQRPYGCATQECEEVAPSHAIACWPKPTRGQRCAAQQNWPADDRYGSTADIASCLGHIRFTPQSGHARAGAALIAPCADLISNYLSERFVDPVLPTRPGVLKVIKNVPVNSQRDKLLCIRDGRTLRRQFRKLRSCRFKRRFSRLP
jgi:hypothetical protein